MSSPLRRPVLFSALALALTAAGPRAQVASTQKVSMDEGNLSLFESLQTSDRFGWSLSTIGDLSGNGRNELAVGAFRDDDGGFDTGAVYVTSLTASGTVQNTIKISSTTGGLGATLNDFDLFGWEVAGIGDLDGDGVEDLAVGAIGDSLGPVSGGAVYILLLNASGTVKATQRIGSNAGGFPFFLDDAAWFGSGIANLGDLDGDGVTDIAVGSYGDSLDDVFQGAVYVCFLNTNGTVKAAQKISASQGGFFETLEAGDEFGWDVEGLGDLDGDGVEDMVVSAILDDDGGVSESGSLFVCLLNTDGTCKATQKISMEAGNLQAVLDSRDHFGRSITNMGDLNGDGITDLAVGAQWDDDGDDDAGAVYLLYLNADGTLKGEQKISQGAGGFGGDLDVGDQFGDGTAAIGDLDGDGDGELIVGADKDDDGSDDAGALYVLFLDISNWTDLGFALDGTPGTPLLSGTGDLTAGSNYELALSNAQPDSTAFVVVSTAAVFAPFKTGTLVPDPSPGLGLFFPLPTGPAGDSAVVAGVWPAGVPAGIPLYFQDWILDPLLLTGFAASNALTVVTP